MNAASSALVASRPRRSDRVTGRIRPTAVSVIAAAHLAVDLAAGAFIATLPATVERLGGSSTMFGILVALYSLTALGLQPLLGRVADRFGLTATVSASAAVAAIVLTMSAGSPGLVLLVTGVVVGGLASGAFHPAAAALARHVAPTRAEGAVAAFAAAGTVGLAVGPVTGMWLVGVWDRPSSLVLLAIPAALASLALARVRAHPTDPRAAERTDLRSMVRLVGRPAAAATMVATAATAITSTIPLLIARAPGHSRTDLAIGVTLAVFSLAMAAGGVVGGGLARRMPSAMLLRAGLTAGAVVGAAAFAVSPGSIAFTVLIGAAGLAIGPAIPVLLVEAQDRLPGSQAAASGIVLGLANGLAGVAFLAISLTHRSLGLEPGALLAIGGLVPGALLVADRVPRAGVRPVIGHCSVSACVCVRPMDRLAA